MSYGETFAPILGRTILALFFLFEAYHRAANWGATVQLLEFKGVPVPAVMHFVALMVMSLGSLSLLIGYHTRLGALGLFGFVLISNSVMHDYWTLADAAQRQAEFDIFARNLAIAGGLLMVMGMGAGKIAVENAKSGKRR